MKPRLGLFVYATDSGLGNQTRAIYEHLKPAKTMLVDLSRLNNLPLHLDWFDYCIKTDGYPSREDVDSFLQDLDVVFVCETPLNYYLYERARQLGVATVQQYNYEFIDYDRNRSLPLPTIFAAPTSWNIEKVREYGAPVVDLPLPIDDNIPKREITSARTFFHNGGRPASHDRNGTHDFIQAAKFANRWAPGAQYILYCQAPTPQIRNLLAGSPVQLVEHLADYMDIYREGDVMVLPRRYGGLCLPLNEAIGSGIPVLMPNISPNNAWLPAGWLLPVMPSPFLFHAHAPVDVYSVHVPTLARKMVELYNRPDLVQTMHSEALALREAMTWSVLLPRYQEVLQQAVDLAKS